MSTGTMKADSAGISGAVVFKDRHGNVAPVDGVPVWAVSDDTVVTMTVAADGMSANFVPTGKVGTTGVTVTADADLGQGVKSLVANGDINVIPAEAVAADLSFGPDNG